MGRFPADNGGFPSGGIVELSPDSTDTIAVTNPLGPKTLVGVPNGTYAPVPSTVDHTVYISTSGSDSNTGLAPGAQTAFATLSHAITTEEAGATSYAINVAVGSYSISAADSSGNGLTVTQPSSRINGAGDGLTQVNISESGLMWGIEMPPFGKLEGISVTYTTGITIPYWTFGTTCLPSGASHSTKYTDIVVTYQNTLTVPTIPGGVSTQRAAAFALAPDQPGVGAMDVAYHIFDRCYVTGGSAKTNIAGFLFGNGTSRNITDNRVNECLVQETDYGIILSGSGVTWVGGGFSRIGGADISVTLSPGEPIKFYGARGELGNLALQVNATDGTCDVLLDGCFAENYTPSSGSVAGQIIEFNAPGTLYILGGEYSTTLHNTSIGLNTGNDSSAVPTLICIGATFDVLDPFPPPSPFYNRIIIGTRYLNPATATSEPNPNYQFVVDQGLDGAFPGQIFVAGTWYPVSAAVSANLVLNDYLYAVPFYVGAEHTFSKIGCNTTVIGTSGAVAELGVYADNGDGYPGDLITDAGSVATTTLGVLEITEDISLAPGLYWNVYGSGGSPATQATVTHFASAPSTVLGASSPAGSVAVGYAYNGAGYTGGALPATFPTGAGKSGGAPVVTLLA